MLQVEHLSKSYGAFRAIADVSFSAQSGQVFGLLGPNGAGKTTLLRILATLLRPDSGTATLAGHDVGREGEAVRRLIGVVNGGMGLYDRLSGREILCYFAGLYGMTQRQADARIEVLNASLGLESALGTRAAGFSTGMKQKIVIARAVIHDPPVLILDEAASGLDVLARRALLDFVLSYKHAGAHERTGLEGDVGAGRLVIYSTHVMSEVEEICDRVAVLDGGELIAQGTVTEMLAKTRQTSLERAFFTLLQDRAMHLGQSA